MTSALLLPTSRILDREQFGEITVIYWNQIGALNSHASGAIQHECPTGVELYETDQVHVLYDHDHRHCSTNYLHQCASGRIPLLPCSRNATKCRELEIETEKELGLDPYPPFPELLCTLRKWDWVDPNLCKRRDWPFLKFSSESHIDLYNSCQDCF